MRLCIRQAVHLDHTLLALTSSGQQPPQTPQRRPGRGRLARRFVVVWVGKSQLSPSLRTMCWSCNVKPQML